MHCMHEPEIYGADTDGEDLARSHGNFLMPALIFLCLGARAGVASKGRGARARARRFLHARAVKRPDIVHRI